MPHVHSRDDALFVFADRKVIFDDFCPYVFPAQDSESDIDICEIETRQSLAEVP